MIIDYFGKHLDEREWLDRKNIAYSWYVYERDSLLSEEMMEVRYYGDEYSLGDLVKKYSAEYAAGTFQGILNISAVSVEEFAPSVSPESLLRDIIFFDGGHWYWSNYCERGDVLPEYIVY